MDAGNMLKPMLARGELRAMGATTLDEYRKNIEKDPALERRVQPGLGEGAGAVREFPAGAGGGAERRGHDRDPPRPEREVRGASRRADPGSGARGRGRALRSLRHGTVPP